MYLEFYLSIYFLQRQNTDGSHTLSLNTSTSGGYRSTYSARSSGMLHFPSFDKQIFKYLTLLQPARLQFLSLMVGCRLYIYLNGHEPNA
jgi:hypothetical protein